MKSVYFIRHAKSSWDDMSLRDIDRPLNSRGLRDAPFMATVLKGKGVKPNAIISSPANRAFTTASFFAKELDIPKKEIKIEPRIYEAMTSEIMDIIQNLPDAYKLILIFGHNPTFTSVANQFTSQYLANLPTCGIFRVDANVESWSQFNDATGELTELHYPKQYFS